MPRRPDRSPQTIAVLDALAEDAAGAAGWRHGYDLARETGLASGTLYPILARLADRRYLERCWEQDPPAGRPPRHLYRLTALGQELRAQVRAEAARQVSYRPSSAGGPAFGARAFS